ncbi:LysR family transcriptional regulator [Eionea flava]
MDIQLLRAFVIAAEEHSFSSAAERLHITQSAISKRIALLEQHIGQILFDRIARKVHLTEAGQRLLPRAQSIINAIDDTQRYMSASNNTVNGELRLATSHHIGIHRLPPILKSYRQRYPDVHLQLQFIDSEHAESLLLQDKCDLAITTLPSHNDDIVNNDIQYHTLWHDPLQIVINPQHPLLQKAKKRQVQPSIAELLSYPVILPNMSTRTTQLILQQFNTKQRQLNIAMTSNHLDAIKMMVAVGLGWSVLPEIMIDNSLELLHIEEFSIIRQLGCLHHRHRTLSNSARAMLHSMQEIPQQTE